MMIRLHASTALFIAAVLLFAGWLAMERPQAQDAPQLSQAQQLQMSNFELRNRNLNLEAELLKAKFAELQREYAVYVATVEVKGYRLQRSEDGSYRYMPAEPTAPPAPKP